MCLVYKSAYSNLILSSPEWVTWKSEKKKSGFSLHTDTSGLCTCPVWHSSVIPGLCFVAVETEPCLLKADNFFFLIEMTECLQTSTQTQQIYTFLPMNLCSLSPATAAFFHTLTSHPNICCPFSWFWQDRFTFGISTYKRSTWRFLFQWHKTSFHPHWKARCFSRAPHASK